MTEQKKIGLALSGGGYRAAAFHLGTLRKLNELKVLDKIDVISCVSGGSIIGGYYCLHRKKPFAEFDKSFVKCLKKSVIGRFLFLLSFFLLLVIAFVSYLWIKGYATLSIIMAIIFILFLLLFTFIILPSSKLIELIYNQIFFKKKSLSHLVKRPLLLINTTNIETGKLWTFSKEKMGDSTYDYLTTGRISFNNKNFPLAKAVAASTCVPFAFSPIKISKSFFKDSNDFPKIRPRLIDGGVYDNQGIHKITEPNSSHKCRIVLVSDAGMKFTNESFFLNNFTLLKRTGDILMQRIRNLQFQYNIYHEKSKPAERIAYFALSWDVDNCIQGFINGIKSKNITNPDLLKLHKITKNDIENFNETNIKKALEKSINYSKIQKQILSLEDKNIARNISTNLHSLNDYEINCLANHASVLIETQIRLYSPSLI